MDDCVFLKNTQKDAFEASQADPGDVHHRKQKQNFA